MNTTPLRIVFAGTPDFAATHLDALIASPHSIAAVYTQPDRPSGRGKKLQPSPVKQRALAAGIRVLQPATLKDGQAQQQLSDLEADLLVVVAYGLILPQAVLDTPALGAINVHASLLPRWRGAAPIQRSIEAGDSETGITIMQMDEGLDTGPMLAGKCCPIGLTTTAANLHDALAEIGAPLLLEVLDDLPTYQARAKIQDNSQATYAKKILKPEAQIDWNRSAQELDRAVRAFNPFPVCFTTVGDTRVKIWEATAICAAQSTRGIGVRVGTITGADPSGIRVRCAEGELCIVQLQLPGGKVLSAGQMLHGKSAVFTPGTLLGEN